MFRLRRLAMVVGALLALGGTARAQAEPADLAAEVGRLEGPAELLERADRLVDDEEKLRREAARLDRHIEAIEERRRLREGAQTVEDDLFVEAGVGRAARKLNVPKTEPTAERFGGGAG